MLLLDLRNRLDFFLRSRLNWGRDVDVSYTLKRDAPFQAEFQEFLSLFDWRDAMAGLRGRNHLVIADVGCRTFLFAPLLEQHFRSLGVSVTLHGIELDAYRRFTDFRTRCDYGKFYASRVEDGHYHPIDVLEFCEELDGVFLLDPFVLKEPLLNWGLPGSRFVPERIMAHVARLLRPRGGFLISSNPDEEELEITRALSVANGFVCHEERTWEPKPPSDSSIRFGIRWSLGPASGESTDAVFDRPNEGHDRRSE